MSLSTTAVTRKPASLRNSVCVSYAIQNNLFYRRVSKGQPPDSKKASKLLKIFSTH
jgi:hypothetical protein